MITKRQYKVLSFFLTRSLFFGLGVSKIINFSLNDAWISAIIGSILGTILLSVIYYLKNSIINKNNFLNITNKILIFLLASLCLNEVILSLTTMTTSFLLPLTPAIIIAISIIISIIYANKKGIQAFAKVSELLLPVSLFIFFIKIISSIIITDYNNFLPILYNHNMNVTKASILFCILSVAPNLLLSNVNTEKLQYQDIIMGYLLGCFTIVLSIFTIIGVLGPTLANILRYPEYLALKKLRVLNIIENLENILVFIWLFDLIILGFVSAFNIKDLITKTIKKENLHKITYFCWISIIVYVGVYLFNRHYANVLLVYKYEPIILFCFIVLILIVLILSIIKQKKTYH